MQQKHKTVAFVIVIFMFTFAYFGDFPSGVNTFNKLLGDLKQISEIGTIVDECGCSVRINHEMENTCDARPICGPRSHARGCGQKVISFSIFAGERRKSKYDNFKYYFTGIEENARLAESLFPDWTIRLYHNLTNATQIDYICKISCAHPNVDLCDIRNISIWKNPNEVDAVQTTTTPRSTAEVKTKLDEEEMPLEGGNLARIHPLMWRFLPIIDETVDFMISRDTDSVIGERELEAVKEWLRSTKIFHAMRDHPLHNTEILGGMWGAKTHQSNDEIRKTAKEMLQAGTRKPWIEKTENDQKLLSIYLWPLFRNNAMVHDSFHCRGYQGPGIQVQPFPTRRTETLNFVGEQFPWPGIKDKSYLICPKECRPKDHQDWIYC